MKLMRINNIAGLTNQMSGITAKVDASTAQVDVLTGEVLNDGEMVPAVGSIGSDLVEASFAHLTNQIETLVDPEIAKIPLTTNGLVSMNDVAPTADSLVGMVGTVAKTEIEVSGIMEARISSLGTGLSTSALSVINSDDGGGIIESGNYVIPVSQLTGDVNIGVDTFNNVLNAGLIQTSEGFGAGFADGANIGTSTAGYTIKIVPGAGAVSSLETMAEFSVNGLDPADPTNKTVLVTYVRNVAPVTTGISAADYVSGDTGHISTAFFNAVAPQPSGTTSTYTVYSAVNRVVPNGQVLFSTGVAGRVVKSVGTTTLVAGKTHIFNFSSTISYIFFFSAPSAKATFAGYVADPAAPDGSLLDSFGALLANSTELFDTVKELGDAATAGEDTGDHEALTATRLANFDELAAARDAHDVNYALGEADLATRWPAHRLTTDTSIADAIVAYNALAESKFFTKTNLLSEVDVGTVATARTNLGLISATDFQSEYISKKDMYMIQDMSVLGTEFTMGVTTVTNADIKWIRKYYPGGDYDDILVESGTAPGKFSVYLNTVGDLDGENVTVRYVERSS